MNHGYTKTFICDFIDRLPDDMSEMDILFKVVKRLNEIMIAREDAKEDYGKHNNIG